MLFVTPHLLYQLTGIVQEEEIYHPHTGKYLRTNPGIDAEFFHGTAPRWAVQEALENPLFNAAWSGLPDDQPRSAMISAYDTDLQAEQNQWSEETKKHVEEFLLRHPDHGKRYFHFEPPSVRMTEPWRGYDSAHHNTIIKIAKEFDTDSQRYALEYELAHQNRKSVVAALQQLVGDEELVSA